MILREAGPACLAAWELVALETSPLSCGPDRYHEFESEHVVPGGDSYDFLHPKCDSDGIYFVYQDDPAWTYVMYPTHTFARKVSYDAPTPLSWCLRGGVSSDRPAKSRARAVTGLVYRRTI